MPKGSREQNNKDINYFILCVAFACLVSVALLIARITFSDSLRYVFLVWNLVLAIIPLILAWWLSDRLKTQSWLKWPQVLATMLFLGFLPNTFYLITDFVHLQQTNEASFYYDVMLLSSFVFNGVLLGFISIYLVHRELTKRLKASTAMTLVLGIFLLASFAAYLGRFTRFNSWDIVLRPAGLLFDVSDRFVNPSQHMETHLATIILFFVLASTYLAFYSALKLFKR